jgi:hypothetical protein
VGVIYLDASLVIYLIEEHARWGAPVADAMRRAGQARFAISPLVKCECLVGPIKRGDPVLERAYTDLFGVFVSLAMPEPVYLQAALLRARFALRTPDTLHWLALSTIAARGCGRMTTDWLRPHTGWRATS